MAAGFEPSHRREVQPERSSVCHQRPKRSRGGRVPWRLAGLNPLRISRFAAVGCALLAVIMTGNAPANAVVAWRPKAPPLSTPWTHLVGPNNALPEYPRPQMARTHWLNLNGVWDYTGRSGQAVLATLPSAERIPRADFGPLPHGVGTIRDPASRRPNVVPQGFRAAEYLAGTARAAAFRRGRSNRHCLGEQPAGGPPRRRVYGVQRGHHPCTAGGIAAAVDRAGRRTATRPTHSRSASSATSRRGCSIRDRRASGRRCGSNRCAPRTSTSSTSPRT